jgi:hypothetical protein
MGFLRNGGADFSKGSRGVNERIGVSAIPVGLSTRNGKGGRVREFLVA